MAAEAYTAAEFMIAQTARLLENGRAVFIGYGMPQIAAILAQRLHAPDMVQFYEFGAIGAQPETPFVRFTMGGPRNCARSLAWTTMNTIFAGAQLGMVDLGVLGATQVDRFGNVNSTLLGPDFHRPAKRFPGAGGANEVLSYCWRTIVVILHEPRRFVPRVDFISSPGFLDGTPGARERAGLPRGTGPYRVVTSKALYGFDAATRQLQLLGVRQGLAPEAVLAEMEFRPLVAEPLATLAPPTPEELRVLREEIDPAGTVIGRPAT